MTRGIQVNWRLSSFCLACLLAVQFMGELTGAKFTTQARAESPTQLNQKIADFKLIDYRGKETKLSDFSKSKVIVLAMLGTECPLVQQYSKRLAELEAKYRDRGVTFIGINANQQDSLEEIAHHARVNKIEFPVLKDAGNIVADKLIAERTPEVFVLDADRVVRYWGRIDDQFTYGIARPKVTHQYLVEAIDSLLAGDSVKVTWTDGIGCHIGRVLKPVEGKSSGEVTYSKQISRILQNRCVQCHRTGEIGPFSLTSYQEVVGWAEMIDEVVQDRRMPPWHANPAHGKFSNDARLGDDELKLVRQWVKAGAPEGDKKDLPPAKQFAEGWQIGKPDQVVYMSAKPYDVPAMGEVKYQYFIVDPGFKEDKWIQAAECRPGNRAVVHHIIVGIAGQRAGLTGGDLQSDWIAAQAPGSKPLYLEDGMAKLVPAGSRLVFQMHYTPNGTAQSDRSSIGFKFADPAKVKRQVATQKAGNNRIAIPPGEANYPLAASTTMSRDMLLLAMFPHMHLRGKSFRYTAEYPDGKKEILLDVPKFDFNWQNGYALSEPKRLPKGTKIICNATFDNSEENLANPDPTKTVRWGDQTWEEMMIGYFNVAPAEEISITDRTKPAEKALPPKEAAAAIAGDKLLASLAPKALATDAGMLAFGVTLKKHWPALDRVCLTQVREGKLEVVSCIQPKEIQAIVGRKVSIAATGKALANYSTGGKTVTHANLSEVKTPDLEFMSRGLSSSVHVPVKIGDTLGTINFWSRDRDAFPPELIAEFEKLAKQMAEGK